MIKRGFEKKKKIDRKAKGQWPRFGGPVPFALGLLCLGQKLVGISFYFSQS